MLVVQLARLHYLIAKGFFLEAKANASPGIAGGFYCGKPTIITTSLAGGLHCPYKGLLPAVHLVHTENLTSALLSPRALKRPFFYLIYFIFFPLNGSIYSFMLI